MFFDDPDYGFIEQYEAQPPFSPQSQSSSSEEDINGTLEVLRSMHEVEAPLTVNQEPVSAIVTGPETSSPASSENVISSNLALTICKKETQEE